MIPTKSKKSVLIIGGCKSEKELEDEEIGDDPVSPTYHLKSHHFMNSTRSQHLNVATVATKHFFLEIG